MEKDLFFSFEEVVKVVWRRGVCRGKGGGMGGRTGHDHIFLKNRRQQ